jgi:hypothetical protein
MNWHVVEFYRYKCLMAYHQREHLSCWFWYTLAELEADPNWKAPRI